MSGNRNTPPGSPRIVVTETTEWWSDSESDTESESSYSLHPSTRSGVMELVGGAAMGLTMVGIGASAGLVGVAALAGLAAVRMGVLMGARMRMNTNTDRNDVFREKRDRDRNDVFREKRDRDRYDVLREKIDRYRNDVFRENRNRDCNDMNGKESDRSVVLDHNNAVDKKMLQALSQRLGGRWKSLGRRLGIDDATLDSIQNDHGTTQEAAYQMLLHWARLNGRNATIENLAEGLRRADRTDLAESVEGE